MITTPNNIILRNLEEQVQENKEQIAKHWEVDRVLADFGITIMGQVETVDDLPASEGTNYGFAYLVGTAVPYEVYIWTRANPNIGQDEPYFMNIGYISTIGPEGPQGEQGEQGEPGVGITSVRQNADYTLTITYGNGVIYNTDPIRGAQGQQGIQGKQGLRGETGATGPTGPVGPVGTLDLRGTLTSADLLPDAATQKPGYAFLIGASYEDYVLYVLVGQTPTEYSWVNIGKPGWGTVVTVGGTAVSEFDADTKVDKWTSEYNYSFLKYNKSAGTYVSAAPAYYIGLMKNGTLTQYMPKEYPSADTAEPEGSLITCDPLYAYQCATKNYVDVNTTDKQTKLYQHNITIYGPAITTVWTSSINFTAYLPTANPINDLTNMPFEEQYYTTNHESVLGFKPGSSIDSSAYYYDDGTGGLAYAYITDDVETANPDNPIYIIDMVTPL